MKIKAVHKLYIYQPVDGFGKRDLADLIPGLGVPKSELAILVPTEAPEVVAQGEADRVSGPTAYVYHATLATVLTTKQTDRHVTIGIGRMVHSGRITVRLVSGPALKPTSTTNPDR